MPGKDYFFHQSAVYGEGLDNLREGDSVEFDVGEGPKGPRAENVRRTSTYVGLRPTRPPKSPTGAKPGTPASVLHSAEAMARPAVALANVLAASAFLHSRRGPARTDADASLRIQPCPRLGMAAGAAFFGGLGVSRTSAPQHPSTQAP